jgi:hypothetical protein
VTDSTLGNGSTTINGARYTPRPGSTCDRALAHLRTLAPGAEISGAALCEATGTLAGSLSVCMQPALDAKLVFARKKGGHVRSPQFWSLVDQTRRATEPATFPRSRFEAFEPPVAEPAAPGPKPAAAAPPAPAVVPAFVKRETEPQKLRIALWSSGELQIERGGELIEFNAAETATLVAYLDRLALPAA